MFQPTPGTSARIARGHYFVGEIVTVVASYRGPFGPSVTVRRAGGDLMAIRVADLDPCPAASE